MRKYLLRVYCHLLVLSEIDYEMVRLLVSCQPIQIPKGYMF